MSVFNNVRAVPCGKMERFYQVLLTLYHPGLVNHPPNGIIAKKYV